MDDGGMQWYAQVGQREEEEQRAAEAKRISDDIEAHRKWLQEFNERQKGERHEME